MKNSFSITFMLLFAFLALVITVMSQSAPESLQTDQIKLNAVKQLNVYKCMHGQSEDDYYYYACCAEIFAQKYANQIAKKGQSLEHSTDQSRTTTDCEGVTGTFGENLGAGYGNWAAAIDGFYNEVEDWDFATHKEKTDGAVTGHFTSLIWKGANRVAFGVQINDNSVYKRWYTMNNGSTTGSAPNSGAYATNVTPLVKTKEECTVIVNTWAAANEDKLGVDCPEDKGKSSAYTAGIMFAFIIAITTLV